ncbi:hypothetical protein [uncultured Alsobacter sp.]|uniref:hypothetical protein n=1 Tax=uncultured Alsobacter sp. TaxID=1748258 RepID=UPI0025D60BF1|nr:hypothetical protein [uncultured Alsobacter sp.]
MAYRTFQVEIGGSSLIMHNGRSANPADQFAKAMKAISSKKKKTDADYEHLANLEFRAGLYANHKGEVVLPGHVLEAAIHGGAKKSNEGKLALSGLFVDGDAEFRYDGAPKTVEELEADPDFRIVALVKVGTARVARTRPHFKNWTATFSVSVDLAVINPDQLRRWLVDCGDYVGIGDWRPRHGRFAVQRIAAIEPKPALLAAE